MKRVYGFISSVLWVVFVYLIAPDISYVRSLLAAMIGWAAIWLIAITVPGSITARFEEAEKIQIQ